MCNYKNKKGLCLDEFFDIMIKYNDDISFLPRFIGYKLLNTNDENIREVYEQMPKEEYLKFSDELLEMFWEILGNVCIDEDENIDEDFWIWEKGTFREDIWHWFDEKHSKGVGWLVNEYEKLNESR